MNREGEAVGRQIAAETIKKEQAYLAARRAAAAEGKPDRIVILKL